MGVKILYIEDNDQNYYLIHYILTQHGYEVSRASHAHLGIEKARAEKPDLILLDIQLPGGDGYWVATTLKNDEETAAIPIVAVTSYAMPGDKEKALAAGCCGYIEKPIHPRMLIEQVEQFLQLRSP